MDGFFFSCLIYCISSLIVLWLAGALFYDVCRASRAGQLIVVVWLAVAIGTFILWVPAWKPFLALLIFFGVFLWWWFSQEPSHHRDWAPGFTELPRVALEGDTLTVQGVRNTDYHGIGESTTHYETRTYRLSEMQGVDALVLYWGSSWMCHPMFVFDFGSDGRLCISIEVRYRNGQQYSFLRSLYRQQELIYVVSDERDAILRRTKFLDGEDLYLYRLHTQALVTRSFFFEYANTINTLSERPRWYHGITTNCTTSIYAQGRGRMQWEWRMLFNGALDQLMYDRELLSQDLPFEELKQQSRVNDIANSAPVDGFSNHLRCELPGYKQDGAMTNCESN